MYFVFNESRRRRYRDCFFFYKEESLIFLDFIGGGVGDRPRLPVDPRRGAGSPCQRRAPAPREGALPVTGPFRN